VEDEKMRLETFRGKGSDLIVEDIALAKPDPVQRGNV